MMKSYCLLVLCLLPIAGFSQTTLYFSYDASGNQILRDLVCVNCGTKAAQIDVPEEQQPISMESITASPNPVTNKLRVQWIFNEKNPLQYLQLHTSDGRLLLRQQINTYSGQVELDFSQRASGLYLLVGVGANGKATTIRIIRQ